MTNKYLSPGQRFPDRWAIVGIVGDGGRFRILCKLDGKWIRSSPILIIVDRENYFEVPTQSGSKYILNSDMEIGLDIGLLNSMIAIQVKIKDLLGSGWGGIEMNDGYFAQFDGLVDIDEE